MEYWIILAGGVATFIGWVIKTYMTFAKQKDVDDRFNAVQKRFTKAIDEIKSDAQKQIDVDKAMGKELHARIDKLLDQSQTLIMTVGEIKGALKRD